MSLGHMDFHTTVQVMCTAIQGGKLMQQQRSSMQKVGSPLTPERAQKMHKSVLRTFSLTSPHKVLYYCFSALFVLRLLTSCMGD